MYVIWASSCAIVLYIFAQNLNWTKATEIEVRDADDLRNNQSSSSRILSYEYLSFFQWRLILSILLMRFQVKSEHDRAIRHDEDTHPLIFRYRNA